jgi:hypothetical protein
VQEGHWSLKIAFDYAIKRRALCGLRHFPLRSNNGQKCCEAPKKTQKKTSVASNPVFFDSRLATLYCNAAGHFRCCIGKAGRIPWPHTPARPSTAQRVCLVC